MMEILTETLDNLRKVFVCTVCSNYLVTPTQIQCGHIFCAPCIHTIQSSKSSTCPICKVKVSRRSLLVRHDVEDLLNAVVFKFLPIAHPGASGNPESSQPSRVSDPNNCSSSSDDDEDVLSFTKTCISRRKVKLVEKMPVSVSNSIDLRAGKENNDEVEQEQKTCDPPVVAALTPTPIRVSKTLYHSTPKSRGRIRSLTNPTITDSDSDECPPILKKLFMTQPSQPQPQDINQDNPEDIPEKVDVEVEEDLFLLTPNPLFENSPRRPMRLISAISRDLVNADKKQDNSFFSDSDAEDAPVSSSLKSKTPQDKDAFAMANAGVDILDNVYKEDLKDPKNLEISNAADSWGDLPSGLNYNSENNYGQPLDLRLEHVKITSDRSNPPTRVQYRSALKYVRPIDLSMKLQPVVVSQKQKIDEVAEIEMDISSADVAVNIKPVLPTMSTAEIFDESIEVDKIVEIEMDTHDQDDEYVSGFSDDEIPASLASPTKYVINTYNRRQPLQAVRQLSVSYGLKSASPAIPVDLSSPVTSIKSNSMAVSPASSVLSIPRTPRKYVFCPTRLTKTQLAKLNELCRMCDGKIVKDYTEDVTHLIINLENNRVPQTIKYLFAIADKKWIVTYDWVDACFEQNQLVGEEPFETSSFPGCDSGVQRSRVSLSALFRGINFYFAGVLKSSGASMEDCKKLIEKLGGRVIDNLYDEDKDVMIIGDSLAMKNRYQEWYRTKGWITVSWEWVLDCILTFDVMPFSTNHLMTTVDSSGLSQASLPDVLLSLYKL